MRLFPKLLLLATLAATLAGPTPAQQQQQTPSPPPPKTTEEKNAGSIMVAQITGEVYIFTAGEAYRLALRAGSLVNAGQMIATGPGASVMLAFSNGSTVTIGEHSLVALDEFQQTPFAEMFKMSEALREPSNSQTRLDLVRGELIANVKKLNKDEGSTFEVKTPLGIAGIRGTTFQITYIPDNLKAAPNAKTDGTTADFTIVMLEGTIEMNTPNRPGPIVIPQGKQLVFENVDTGSALTDEDGAAEPSNAPATTQALLMQRVQTMLSVTAGISIPGTPGAPARPPVNTVDGPNEKPQDNDSQKQDADSSDAGDDFNDTLPPAPAPQTPAPRLSPTDGTGA